jgi:hypothetical protein
MLKFIDLYMANNAWQVDTMIKIEFAEGDTEIAQAQDLAEDYGDYEVDWFDNNIVGIHKEDD